MFKRNFKKNIESEIFHAISNCCDETKIECYAIGGFVRDLIIGKTSAKDIDILVVGSGINIAKKTAKKLKIKSKITIFKNFGTAMFKYDGYDIEFVGTRQESYNESSRNPLIKPGTLDDDLNRRDFTINTLGISLNKKNWGDLLDKFDGITDLENRIIKTPLEPRQTFSDDPLRMLRAARFSSQLNFQIDINSFNGLISEKERIKIISPERISEEINKIIMTSKPSVGFKILESTGLLKIILPELTNLKGIEEIEGQKHKDNFFHTLEVLDNICLKTENLWLRWAALLHDIGKAPTKLFIKKTGWTFHGHELKGSKMVYKLFKRLKMPLNAKMKFVQKMVLLSSRPIVLASEVSDAAVRRLVFDAGNDINSLMTLCEADITTKNSKKFKRYHKNFELVRTKIKQVEERDKVRNFQPPVSGAEIMKTFNLKPCREIGQIKEAIKEAILDGEIPNEHQASYEFMIEKGKQLGLKLT